MNVDELVLNMIEEAAGEVEHDGELPHERKDRKEVCPVQQAFQNSESEDLEKCCNVGDHLHDHTGEDEVDEATKVLYLSD